MEIKIPQQSIVYLTVCFSGILLYVFAGIVPTQGSLRELDGTIAETKVRIEEQKLLISIQQSLKERAQKREPQMQGTRALPFPQKNAQALGEVAKLTETMKDLARRANVEVVSIAPGLSSLDGNSKTLAVEVVVKGAFQSFRRFLIGLGGLPYLQHVEELQCQQNPEGTKLRVKFWLILA